MVRGPHAPALRDGPEFRARDRSNWDLIRTRSFPKRVSPMQAFPVMALLPKLSCFETQLNAIKDLPRRFPSVAEGE